jgi:hypothetical protein
MVNGRYLLRACLVNFRTKEADLDILLDLIVAFGATIEREMASEPSINHAESLKTGK